MPRTTSGLGEMWDRGEAHTATARVELLRRLGGSWDEDKLESERGA